MLDYMATAPTIEAEEGGGCFDGVLAYSCDAAFAAQVMIRHAAESCYEPPLFRFAVFINGATPLRVFKVGE
ncbi:hypothetical protein B0H66DRAFT_605987 [Apodospora peruviana]|uniref:Uncharacterized protein n=1 Tax=Apodospora peruviana TaxID=516989 RepID=A0AAE0M0V3_9PEZI|nr:hypothetical protein B0H66DRAFT_605987 [Apodospora peruviana]